MMRQEIPVVIVVMLEQTGIHFRVTKMLRGFAATIRKMKASVRWTHKIMVILRQIDNPRKQHCV
jgi:ethanolamine transporter EutH